MLHDCRIIKEKLIKRGVVLNKSASIYAIRACENVLGINLSKYFIKLFLEFDGFTGYNYVIQIIVWDLRKIYQTKIERKINGFRYFASADLLVDSEFFMFSLDNEKNPVFLCYQSEEIASSASEFFHRLLNGEFDFVQKR